MWGLNLELVKAFARQTLLSRFLEIDLEFDDQYPRISVCEFEEPFT